MIHRLPWIDRKFSFDFDVRTFPDVVERFRGTPARIEDKVRSLSPTVLTASDGGWSIQQNVGHLLDLEPLFLGRIEDFMAGRPELRAADMSNAATHQAGHNDRDIRELTAAFRAQREHAAARLDSLRDDDFGRLSVHPRLKVRMRLVDAIAFVCAHDDYHLARITELIRAFS
jgi:uncharacterized damage-inducible protein DinB